MVPELQWNQLVPESNPFMLYGQLRLIEESQKHNMQFKYAFIKNQDLTVGIVYFQVVRFTGNDLLNYFPESPAGFKKYLYGFIKYISKLLVSRINVKLLVSGNVFMTGENGFYFQHSLSKKERSFLLLKAIDEVAKTDDKIKGILIPDLYQPKSDFDKGFVENGFNEITVEADMGIKLKPEWKSFDDYLNALSSKYRVRAKKVIALCNENGVIKKELTESDIEKYEDKLFELYQDVMSRAEFKLATLEKDYFRMQKKSLPYTYRVFSYFKDDEMIGFISLYQFGKKMEVHYTGMNPEKCKPIHLYQHMLYDMISFGIVNAVEKLHFGRTAPEIKSTIGAVPSPMYGYLKHFNPFLNFFLVRTFTSNLKPKDYVIRNPFKV